MANKICKKGKLVRDIKDSNDHAVQRKSSGDPEKAAKINKALKKKAKRLKGKDEGK